MSIIKLLIRMWSGIYIITGVNFVYKLLALIAFVIPNTKVVN